MKIGMRNIKTAFAVLVGIWVSKLLSLDSVFYVTVAALLAMQSSVKDSFEAGKHRIIGTFIGGIIGFAFVSILPGNSFMIAIGLIVLIYICNKLDFNQSISIAGIVFIGIMINIGEQHPLEYSFLRILDTFVGIVIAVLINYFIVPPNNLNNIYNTFKKIREINWGVIKDKLYLNKEIDLGLVEVDIVELKKYMEIYLSEVKIKKDDSHKITALKEKLSLYVAIYEHLKVIEYIKSHPGLNDENALKLKGIFGEEVEVNENQITDEFIVYNYHINYVLENMIKIERLSEDK